LLQRNEIGANETRLPSMLESRLPTRMMALRKPVSAPKKTSGAARAAASRPELERKHDPVRTQHDILEVATEEFARDGLAGARVDTIAARTRTSKRMIYYYFSSKEGLYLAVLERAYAQMRAAERELDLVRLPPREAIRRLVQYQFDYEEAHPELARLVSIENIHDGVHVAKSETIQKLNVSVIEMLAAILKRGRREGIFHTAIDAIDLHLLIIAPCFYRISNHHTFGTLFGRDLLAPAVRARHRRMFADSIVGYLEGTPKAAAPRARAAQNGRPRKAR
jgi:AcrR family transcriptional regulator